MTQAVCFKCGDIKWGAFSNCENCGARPKSDDDLMLSLAFTDHYFELAKLQQFGRDVAAGRSLQLDPSTKEKLLPAVREAKVMLGIDRGKKPETGPRGRLFYSPGLTWPFFAAVACLIMMWTMIAMQQRWVRSSDNPLFLFGFPFGLLSGVVLFAIMRAFDRGRR